MQPSTDPVWVIATDPPPEMAHVPVTLSPVGAGAGAGAGVGAGAGTGAGAGAGAGAGHGTGRPLMVQGAGVGLGGGAVSGAPVVTPPIVPLQLAALVEQLTSTGPISFTLIEPCTVIGAFGLL